MGATIQEVRRLYSKKEEGFNKIKIIDDWNKMYKGVISQKDFFGRVTPLKCRNALCLGNFIAYFEYSDFYHCSHSGKIWVQDKIIKNILRNSHQLEE